MRQLTHGLASLGLGLLILLAAPHAPAANIQINNLDGAGEGFNDPTPAAPVGGNPGTTLGQQRLNVFQRAAEIWGGAIESTVTIVVDANLDPLACTESSGTLGAAGAIEVFRDFPGAAFSNTWYHVALANAIAGTDLSPGTSDIVATFNSDIDNNNDCLANTNWYLGYDNNPGAGISLLVVLLHEFAHGLGFSGFVDIENGSFLDGRDDIFAINTFDLTRNKNWTELPSNVQRRDSAINTGNVVWEGAAVTAQADNLLISGLAGAGNARLFTPDPVDVGSSVYHYDTVAAPNLLMEPELNFGQGSALDLSDELLLDLGWIRRDTDGDGLSNTDEIEEFGTDPDDIDSDDDGLTDGDEFVTVASYPTGVDADNDGFVDGENDAGTDPNNDDSDNDGISDGMEQLAGTDPNDAAPEVVIGSPINGANYLIGEVTPLMALAMDPEDGNLGAAIQWSSDQDGFLGAGTNLNVILSPNNHLITAAATDSAGAQTQVQLAVSVDGLPGDINNDGQVDVADRLLLHQALLNLITLSIPEQQRADLHPAGGNAIVDVGDLLVLECLLTAP